jgi:hypothetical protein
MRPFESTAYEKEPLNEDITTHLLKNHPKEQLLAHQLPTFTHNDARNLGNYKLKSRCICRNLNDLRDFEERNRAAADAGMPHIGG